jgi:hypothetical protein
MFEERISFTRGETMGFATISLFVTVASSLCLIAILYLCHVNSILKQTPEEGRRLSSKRWTPALLSETYKKLEECPIDFDKDLPPKLDRRYIGRSQYVTNTSYADRCQVLSVVTSCFNSWPVEHHQKAFALLISGRLSVMTCKLARLHESTLYKQT